MPTFSIVSYVRYSSLRATIGSTRGAKSGNQAGGSRHGGDERRHAGRRCRIVRARLKEQGLHQLRQRERGGEASRRANTRQLQAVPHDTPEHDRTLGAERHPDPDLMTCVTRYDSTPYVPIAARIRARAANEATRRFTTASRGLDRLDSEFLSQVSVKAVRASARRYQSHAT
jgi:hypothetical protein